MQAFVRRLNFKYRLAGVENLFFDIPQRHIKTHQCKCAKSHIGIWSADIEECVPEFIFVDKIFNQSNMQASGNCMARCISGKVWMSNNEVLTEKELSQGLVLTCTGYPVGGPVELSFDNME